MGCNFTPTADICNTAIDLHISWNLFALFHGFFHTWNIICHLWWLAHTQNNLGTDSNVSDVGQSRGFIKLTGPVVAEGEADGGPESEVFLEVVSPALSISCRAYEQKKGYTCALCNASTWYNFELDTYSISNDILFWAQQCQIHHFIPQSGELLPHGLTLGCNYEWSQ